MKLTTEDIRVNGYPPLDEVLAYFDALPVLLGLLRRADPSPDALAAWDAAISVCRDPLPIAAVSRKAERMLDPDYPVEA